MKSGTTAAVVLTFCALIASPCANAQSATSLPASAIPDLVVPPNGINLGSSSFYDGFSTLDPGVTVLQYVRHNDLNTIKDANGHASSAFVDPQINVTTSVTQISIVSPLHLAGGVLGFDVLLPVTRIDSRFGSGGTQLRDNGTGIGDLTFGPFIQFKPFMSHGHPVASIRVALDAIAPTGDFNRYRDLNQGSGYWSFNPYLAVTVLPAKGWELSARVQYLYNFKTTKIPNAPEIPGFAFEDGRAGQLIYSNFDVSREIVRGVAIGVNGFAVQQLDNDKINGISLPDTKRSAVYVGPGIHIDRLPKFAVNANVYLPVTTRNYATGPQLNVQFILPIR